MDKVEVPESHHFNASPRSAAGERLTGMRCAVTPEQNRELDYRVHEVANAVPPPGSTVISPGDPFGQ